MRKIAQKFVSTSLFIFQDLKLNTKDIIIVVKDTLNNTSGPLPIPDPHVTGVPCNTLETHSIGSRVVNGDYDLITNFSMAKLVGSPTSNSKFTY
jgi:hypothetical protein